MPFLLKKRRAKVVAARTNPHRPIPIRHTDFAFNEAQMSKYCWDDNAFS